MIVLLETQPYYFLFPFYKFWCVGEGHQAGNECGYSNSLFQTGSGKFVNISSAGLVKAKTLLGLEEDDDHCNFQDLQHTRTPSTPISPCGWQSVSNLPVKEVVEVNQLVNVAQVPRPSSICNSGLPGHIFKNEINSGMMPSESPNSAPKLPPIKFLTAGGRSLSVSSDALQYARSLLGDPELGTPFDEGTAGESDLSFFKEARLYNSISNKEIDVFTSTQEASKNRSLTKSFTSPLRSFSNQAMSMVNLENIYVSGNLIKKFDAVDDDRVGVLDELPPMDKTLSNMPSAPNTKMVNPLEDINGSRSNSLGRSFGKPLADITNRIGAAHHNIKQNSSEKRRQWRSSVSPFKRPRSSKFSTPLVTNVSLANGKFSKGFELTLLMLALLVCASH